MKKIIILFLFLLIPTLLPAPERRELPIVEEEPIYKFDPMLYAFKYVESTLRTDVVNSLGYKGILQIGQEMVDEANRICIITGNPMRFTIMDAFNEYRSSQIWYVVQNYHNPRYELRKACHIWNPKGSPDYYNRIKREMRSL